MAQEFYIQREELNLDKPLVAHAVTTIHAPVATVWNALVDPAIIKQYMFGATVTSDWKEGSPMVWNGEWQDAVAGHGVRRVARMVRGIGLGAVRTLAAVMVRLMPYVRTPRTDTTFGTASGRNVLRLQTGDGDVLRRGLWILENTQPASRTSASPVSYRHDMVRLKPDTTSE